MTNATVEVKRGVGRPATFPGQETKMAGFKLPIETLERLATRAEEKGLNQNDLVNRALTAYMRDRSRKG